MPPAGCFKLIASSGNARRGTFSTAHGAFDTPNFMPVGTQGTVKGVSPERLKALGAQIILSNTYHLHIRPGDELIRDLGGLHQFMGWDGPILTDSGGFQVFSLGKLCKVSDAGVRFQSHVDGAEVMFSPEKVVEIQRNLGVDIMMVLDVCPPSEAPREVIEQALRRTELWAKRSLESERGAAQLMFGITQGGTDQNLRERSIEEISALPFDGFAIGGVSVGEPVPQMRAVVEHAAPLLPENKIRYLMGVGTPVDLVHAIAQGVDLFDCVIPTRSARFGRIFCGNSYYNIKNTRFRSDPKPLEEGCDCSTCQRFSRAYIAHLVHAEEVLAIELCSIHNLRLYERLMESARAAISADLFAELLNQYGENDADSEQGECVG